MSYPDIYDEPELSPGKAAVPVLDPVNHPVIATVNIIAAELFDILGPMCWAALIVLFLVAEFASN
jgi:hypothetical protein